MNSVGLYLLQGSVIVLVTASRIKRLQRHAELLWFVCQFFCGAVNFITGLWFYFAWSILLAVISGRQLIRDRREKC
jgi:hypothetical protein